MTSRALVYEPQVERTGEQRRREGDMSEDQEDRSRGDGGGKEYGVYPLKLS